MAAVKFKAEQIEKFNDRIENCLCDPTCRRVFEFYLSNVFKKDNLSNTLKLWAKAEESSSFDDDILDLMDDVDGFNADPLLTLAEADQKVAYVRSECCRIFSRSNAHKGFIQYLVDNCRQ